MTSRFLLIRWGGLGDLLVALPAIQVLRHAFPSAWLTLVGRPGYASLMREAGVIDDVIDGGGPVARRLFSGSEPSGTKAVDGKWLDAFDLVLGWLNQREGCLIDADGGAPGGGRRL